MIIGVGLMLPKYTVLNCKEKIKQCVENIFTYFCTNMTNNNMYDIINTNKLRKGKRYEYRFI